MKETPRMQALDWWKHIAKSKRFELATEYFGRVPESLTGREIETIWHNQIH